VLLKYRENHAKKIPPKHEKIIPKKVGSAGEGKNRPWHSIANIKEENFEGTKTPSYARSAKSSACKRRGEKERAYSELERESGLKKKARVMLCVLDR